MKCIKKQKKNKKLLAVLLSVIAHTVLEIRVVKS